MIAKSQPVGYAWPEILYDDIGALSQLTRSFQACLVLQIQFDALFSSVEAQEIRALTVDERGPPVASFVADSGFLDFDHACSQVREQHRAKRTSDDAGEVKNSDAFEQRQLRHLAHNRS